MKKTGCSQSNLSGDRKYIILITDGNNLWGRWKYYIIKTRSAGTGRNGKSTKAKNGGAKNKRMKK